MKNTQKSHGLFIFHSGIRREETNKILLPEKATFNEKTGVQVIVSQLTTLISGVKKYL